MPNLTPYQEQSKRERKELGMQARCAEAREEERRLEERLRAWTKRELGQVDLGLTDDWFPLLAHNWYLTGLQYGTGDPALLAKARRVKEVMDHYQSLQRLIWRRSGRLVSLALRQVDGRYGAQWTYPKLPLKSVEMESPLVQTAGCGTPTAPHQAAT